MSLIKGLQREQTSFSPLNQSIADVGMGQLDLYAHRKGHTVTRWVLNRYFLLFLRRFKCWFPLGWSWSFARHTWFNWSISRVDICPSYLQNRIDWCQAKGPWARCGLPITLCPPSLLNILRYCKNFFVTNSHCKLSVFLLEGTAGLFYKNLKKVSH